MTYIAEQVARRRTFAIISHPDAGKTTLTEKFLLFGGALQLAGAVRSKGNRRRTASDWMRIEQQRGISVMTSVMTFDYDGCFLNMLDTPGHEDFCEDTYRTLSAVDSAIMVIDAAKGIEAQTLKLFEVCRLRDMPIITFINKIDLESRDPFDLLDEIENRLMLETIPLNWPIGCGNRLVGLYDLPGDSVRLSDTAEPFLVSGPDDPKLEALLLDSKQELISDIALAKEASRAFNTTSYREGNHSPVFFGSALRDLGVRDLINAIVKFAPPPQSQVSDKRRVEPTEEQMTGFIFKIQANMDKHHRDRIAFMRVSSGVLKRGMKVKLPRTGKSISLRTPQFFFAQDRILTDEAVAGDVVGLHNHGLLRIGDTLTEGEDLAFHGIPSFAPDILRRVCLKDAMRAKKMHEAMRQLAEEGVVQFFTPIDGALLLIGVTGALQLDVLISRMAGEYNISVSFEISRFQIVRWISSLDQAVLDRFVHNHRASMAEDADGALVFLADSVFMLNYEIEGAPAIAFDDVKTYQRAR